MDRWNTYAFEFAGGLISNLPPLQQGIKAPGSARVLRNFESSVEGGYQRILGFSKYDTNFVPSYADVKVQGSGQTGSTLNVANLYYTPVAGESFTIAGVTGTYTIATGGVSYNSTNKTATLTLTTSLASSPADLATITFTSNTGLINGLAAWEGKVIAVRNNNVYYSTGSNWTKVNVPSYGTVLINGAGQTGSSLVVDGLTYAPQAGDTFTVAGIEKVYTVLSDATVSSGGATLSIAPSLASSPADNAAITFLTASLATGNRCRFSKYRIATVEKITFVDGVNPPMRWDGTTFTVDNSAVSDVVGAEHVVWFKNQMFYAKGDKLGFTAPYTDNDYTAANGAGIIAVGSAITGLIVFREQLIIFSQRKISRLVGNTLADFVLQPITENVGCIDTDTIQEVGGDVMFLGPDGLRLLSATDRIGDFGLAVVSKVIQQEMSNVINTSTSFASVVVKKKSQYRLFGYSNTLSKNNALGVIGTQILGDQTTAIAWSELRGFKVYVADSNYRNKTETIVFSNDTGYVYSMESGYSLDGDPINALFFTPFVPINDPSIRKAFYKLRLYTDPEGNVTMNCNLKFDFDEDGVIQPSSIILSNTATQVGIYGYPTTTYGVARYGTRLKKVFETQTIGAGFVVSLQFDSSSAVDPPYSLDAAILEYATFDRR